MEKATLLISLIEPADGSLVRRILTRFQLANEEDPSFRLHGKGLMTLRLEQEGVDDGLEEIRAWPGVRRVAKLASGQRLSQMPATPRRERVAVTPDFRIGAPDFALIAGPCSVESQTQVTEIAAAVKEAGARMLRGGAFKPRTSPYEFGGLGRRGLEYLAAARAATGLPIVTEVLHRDELDLVAEYADVLQIGSRSMYNNALLFAAGRHPAGKPILLKRAFSATITEVLEAAEHILLGRFQAGLDEPRLILCERGIRLFNDLLRFSFDVSAIPHLRARTPLPVIADPSHPAGDRRYVEPLALAATAAGADGLIVEVSNYPDQAWCDSAQCLSIDEFRRLTDKAKVIARTVRD